MGNNRPLYIKSIRGLENVSTIGAYAFSHTAGTAYEESGSITGGSIKIKDGATIGAGAFAACTFDNVTMGKNVTLNSEGSRVFNHVTINETLQIGDGTDLTSGLGINSAGTVKLGKNVVLTFDTFISNRSGGYYDRPTITNLVIDSNVPERLFSDHNGSSANITNITFGPNCSSIGAYAFSSGATGSIQSITGLANVKSIGISAFQAGSYSSKFTTKEKSVLAENLSLIEIGEGATVADSAFAYANTQKIKVYSGATIESFAFTNNTAKEIDVESNVILNTYAFVASTIDKLNIANNVTLNSGLLGGNNGYGQVKNLSINSNIPEKLLYNSTYSSKNVIETLYIGDAVTSVNEDAFYRMTINNVSLPNTLSYEDSYFNHNKDVVITVREAS